MPLQTRNVRIKKVGLLDSNQSRGAVSHAPADIRWRVAKHLVWGGHVGLLCTMGFIIRFLLASSGEAEQGSAE